MIDLPLILLAAFVAGASPGPATLAIAGTSMASGRRAGLVLASGITLGSLTWSVAAALGLGAVMLTQVWLFEAIRLIGGGYLLLLAAKSARAALSRARPQTRALSGSSRRLFARGLALHLTNPKAVLFFGALYAIGVPPDASASALLTIILAVGLQSALTFHGYALLFSTPSMTRLYLRLRRPFEALFALGFGAAGLRVLTARLP
ncbi:LysE family translocator [Jannaschia sp. M317]|uniref:LysE family translocator n=1 Tax=Jannaschia sp. M317 TaxID=2867011 RepID=UPI0021A8D5D2|nr:LysE family transporter [Jannaschia sp. M317]UWQ19137.1 LysE family transporter [Jannaschia sp. M317]